MDSPTPDKVIATMTLFDAILGFFISLAANSATTTFYQKRAQKLSEALADEEGLRKALTSGRSLRDEVRETCVQLAQNLAKLDASPQEEPLWGLMLDVMFQQDLVDWLMAGGIDEGNVAKARLISAIESTLEKNHAQPEQIVFLRTDFFETLERAIFSNPILAYWRHQLSLNFLREQVALLRKKAEEAAGCYSSDRQRGALDQYRERALKTWDIIDLSGLPEGDIQIATQVLLLRQLYMPLRIAVESGGQGGDGDAGLARLEEDRENRRLREAGRGVSQLVDGSSPSAVRCSVGERLAGAMRLVVLGDPGGGKTTMLRWMATAYLLRYGDEPAFSQLPDTETLPDHHWIPVLIRCRDLGTDDLCHCFKDFLTEHLHKSELLPEDADIMRAVILDNLAKGQALLLVDGLDEISDPRVRMMFCQELERTAVRYPDAPIVITSRIVGYRDMPYRMGSGFEHGVIAELTPEDKDLFARRWVAITEQRQSEAEKAKRAKDLLDSLHSSDRIERLTGNPMLLTTLALVKRKVGKLPNRRTRLYAEAVLVLLNWNYGYYERIEDDEAIPQLEYLAYEMCRRGVQRLTGEEVLDLLDKVRIEYPNIRAMRQRGPDAFLGLLEARSSILIKSGGIWSVTQAKEKSVWEFRHLTFQEYLAARAIIDGRYPGRDRTKALAEQVAPLATAVNRGKATSEPELEVSESWREVLRLLVADCRDDDVDATLLSILHPLSGEDQLAVVRPRAVLAALCLADEPNVSEGVAVDVLRRLANEIDENDGLYSRLTTVDSAVWDVAGSRWCEGLKRALLDTYFQRGPESRDSVGALLGAAVVRQVNDRGMDAAGWVGTLAPQLRSLDREEAAMAALSILHVAFYRGIAPVPEILEALLANLRREPPVALASAWALVWIGGWSRKREAEPAVPLWKPSKDAMGLLLAAFANCPQEESYFMRFVAAVLSMNLGGRVSEVLLRRLGELDEYSREEVASRLGDNGDRIAIAPLSGLLDDPAKRVRIAAAGALTVLGDQRGYTYLRTALADSESRSRRLAVGQLARTRAKADQQLLTLSFDATDHWIDPREKISKARVVAASTVLSLSENEVRSRYEVLAEDFLLKLEWRTKPTNE